MNEQYYTPQRFSILPPVVKNLLIINGLFFLATIAFAKIFNIDLAGILGLHYFQSELFYPHQMLTYMFMHGDIGHILFNMFALWMFGSTIERNWGSKRFLIYYLVTGIGAGLVQEMVYGIRIHQIMAQLSPEAVDIVKNNGLTLLQQSMNYTDNLMGNLNLLLNTGTVGASGSVFGLLLAFGMMFPNALIYIYFLFPLKAKWVVLGYGVLELWLGIANKSGDNIAHFAHLGGMVFGLLLIMWWKKKDNNNFFQYYS